MIEALRRKMVSITPPAAIVDNASFTTAEVDTIGYDYAVITVYLGALDIALTALKVTEADVSATSHADVTGLVFGTDGTLPSATDDNKFFQFYIDLRARKRYLDLVVTMGDGTTGGFVTAWCELYRGKIGPQTAAEQGLSQRLIA